MAKISAGRIVLPDLVQNLSFNVSGEEKLKTIGRALNDIASGTKAHEYISDQETMIRRLISSYEDFNRVQSRNNAGELIKSFNALKAVSDGIDLSKIVSDFERVDAAYQKASQDFGKDFTGFSADRFRDVAEAMSELAHYGVDVGKVLERLGQSSNVGKLHEQIRELEGTIGRLSRELRDVTQQRDDLLNGAELQRLQEIEEKFHGITETMANEFRSFLHANDLDSNDAAWGKYYDYFEAIKNGSMTAKEAITNVRTELAEMIQTAQPGDTVFSSTQMDEFISKLDIACRSIELMRSEIEELNNRAIMRGAAQEMAESAELTEKQREAMHGLVQESAGLNNVSQILVALVENFDTTDERIQTSVNSFNNLLNILDSIAHVEPANMSGFNDVLKNLRMISEFDINSKKMAELEAAMSSLAKIPNLSNLSMLGSVDLRGFNDLSASKASLNNLATYLPELSQNVNVEKLRALSQISLANFSSENLKVSKASMDHLRELILTINGNELDQTKVGANAGQDALVAQVEKVSRAVKNESAAMREASEAKEADVASAEAAAKAEEDKRKISELLAEALKREEEAARKAGESAEQDAEKTKKAGQAAEEATASVDKLSSIWDKMFLGKFSAELVKVQEQFSALQEKPEKLAQNMQLLEKAEREMREATSMEGKLEAYNRFSTILDVVRSQIGAVNAEAKNSNTDFRNLLNMVKQANSAMEGIGNSSFTNKLREMSAKTKGIADESVIQNLTRMRQAYVDMQSAYGTSGPSSTQDYEALINAHLRWKEALNGLNQALAANRAETSANKQSNAEAAQAAREIANGAAAAEKQLASLNAVFESLRDKTKFDTSSFEQMKALLDTVNNTSLDTATRQSALQQLNEMIEKTSVSLKEMANAEKDEARASKELEREANIKASTLDKLDKLLIRCTNAEEKFKAAQNVGPMKESYSKLKDITQQVRELAEQFRQTEHPTQEMINKARELGLAFSETNTKLQTNSSLLGRYMTTGFQQLKSRLTYSLGLAAMVYKTVGEIKKMVSTAVELDSAMNTLQIVTRASGAEMEEYGRRVSSMAKETAQATKDLIDATTVYARLGYSMDESATLSRYTAMLQGVGDIGATEAQNAMTAIIKAFGKNVNDIEDVMDKLVRVGNNYPISVSQLAEGMNNASSMLAVAGNSFEESVALLTAANTTIQNVSKASTGLRTIAARIRKTTTGEDDDGEIVEEAKYQEMINALTKKHVSLVDEVTGEYRSTYDIIRDIAKVWDDLTSMEQAAVIEALAGTRQQNIFTSLVTQFQEAEGALEDMNNATGELQESYDIYLNSIQAHVQTMKAAFDELSMDFVNGGFAKRAVDFLTKIIELLDYLITNLGVLGTALTAIGTTAIIRGVAEGSMAAGFAGLAKAAGAAVTALKGVAAAAPELLLVAAAIAAITFAVRKYKEANKTTEDLKSAASSAKTEAEDAEKAYRDVADQIDENKNKIKQLQTLVSNGTITREQRDELENLITQNETYEQQVAILERKAELAKKSADEAQREAAYSQWRDVFGDKSTTYSSYLFGGWDRAGGDASVVLGGRVPESHDITTKVNELIGSYNYSVLEVGAISNAINDKLKSDSEEVRESADALIDDLDKAEEKLQQTEDAVRQQYLDLMALREQFDGLDDPKSVAMVKEIDDLLDLIDKALPKSGKTLTAFKHNFELLDKTIRDKFSKGIHELTDREMRDFDRWMKQCGYTAEDLSEYLAEWISELGETPDGFNDSVWENIGSLTSFRDELSRTKAALEEYNKAMEGGEKGDDIASMQEIYKGALEDMKNGKYDTNRLRAAASLFFTPQQLADMNFDMREIGRQLQSSMMQGLFDPDEQSQLTAGQRLIKYIKDNAKQFEGVAEVMDIGGGNVQFWYNSIEELANAFGMSEEAVIAFLDEWDAYGVEVIRSVKENKELIEQYLTMEDKIGDTKETVKQLIEQMHNNGSDQFEISNVLQDMRSDGYIGMGVKELNDLIAETVQKLKETNDSEAEPKITIDNSQAISALQSVQNYLYSIRDKSATVTITTRYITEGAPAQNDSGGQSNQNNQNNSNNSGGGVNTHALGAAKGKRPGHYGGNTLVNELGPELISDEGKAFIANNGKPGFVNLSKDAIVFTASETEEILHGSKKNIKTRAYADGTGRSGLIGRLLGRGTPARAWWYCSKCGRANPDTSSRCESCGTARGASSQPAVQTWQCQWCGYNNPTTVGICQSCRRSRYGGSQQVPITTTPTTPVTTTTITTTTGPLYPVNPDPVDGGSGGGGGGSYGGSSYSEPEPQKFDWIEVRLSRIQRVIQDLSRIASSGFKRLTTRVDAAKDQIEYTKKEIRNQELGYERYLQEARAVGLDESLAASVREGDIDIELYDDDTRKKIQEYQEWYEKALACKSAIDELHLSIAQLYQDMFDNTQTDFENRLGLIEHEANMAQKNLDLASTKGYLDSATFYEQMATAQSKTINTLKMELAELQAKFKEAMDSGEIDEESEAWFAMKQAIADVEEAIADANTQLVEYQRTIRSINWSYFDYAQERFSQMTEEAEFLINLMSNHDLFRENGQFNDLGAATAGMHAVNYDAYMAQADEYAKEIQKINRELENDPADTELIARRETLLGLQRQSILSAEAEKNAVKDLIQNGINKELEALKDLIDTYKDSIDSAKELYDYQKKVSEQTASIATIQKQLSAYTNDTSEETRAKVQKLNKDLQAAQTNLAETERDQSISDQKKLLDELYEEYESLMNGRLDNVDLLMQEIIAGTNENMDEIRNTLIAVGDEVGYTLTDQMQQAMRGDLGYYDHMFDGINSIQVVLDDIYRMVGAMAQASGAVRAYATGGLVDYTGLAAVHGTSSRPELVLNASDTENFLAAAQMLRDSFFPKSSGLPTGMSEGGGGLSIGQFQINIPIERVQDYNDFVSQLRNDPKFERLISAMTLDKIAGKSGFEKNRIRF